jgi:YbgC/YbaW family acyl-CoA thioester hydrolase
MPQASVRIRVPFPDVDSTGRIHFTAMLRYMEIAEHELMRSIGFPYANPLSDTALPRVHVECDFRKAVRYDDVLMVEARVHHVGRSSWTVAFTTRSIEEVARTEEQDSAQTVGEIVAEGKMTIVAMDSTTERAKPLPDDLRRTLAGIDT